MVEITPRPANAKYGRQTLRRAAALALAAAGLVANPLASAQIVGNVASTRPALVATNPDTNAPVAAALTASPPPDAAIRRSDHREDDSVYVQQLPMGIVLTLGSLALAALGMAASALYLTLRRRSAAIAELQQLRKDVNRLLGAPTGTAAAPAVPVGMPPYAELGGIAIGAAASMDTLRTYTLSSSR